MEFKRGRGIIMRVPVLDDLVQKNPAFCLVGQPLIKGGKFKLMGHVAINLIATESRLKRLSISDIWGLSIYRFVTPNNTPNQKITLYFAFIAMGLRNRFTIRGRSQITLTIFHFFWPPIPLRWHLLPYKCWPKVYIFGLPTLLLLWTTPSAFVL